MKLNLRRAAKRRLPKRERVPLYVPEHPDTVWSADFMLDALACGRPFRTFNITDDFNREIIHIEVDTSITSQRLVRIFERIRQERPLPQVLRVDNGPEFLGEVFVAWAKQAGMAIVSARRFGGQSGIGGGRRTAGVRCRLRRLALVGLGAGGHQHAGGDDHDRGPVRALRFAAAAGFRRLRHRDRAVAGDSQAGRASPWRRVGPLCPAAIALKSAAGAQAGAVNSAAPCTTGS
ncbi:hypothetical protein HNQ58_000342 [Rehaibacterium terrae]|uniref:Integrase catalytic domain-containing protein n=1 Tax=Rehaibacterium terrae TaxID=1341696 RepID=A0A7W7XX86_9GAMM|nr:hypothetical protein [Rehaibacterium terrae]